jgi:hypothetical protein
VVGRIRSKYTICMHENIIMKPIILPIKHKGMEA